MENKERIDVIMPMVRELAAQSYIDGLNLSAKIVDNVIAVAEKHPHASKECFVFLELTKKNIHDAIELSKKELTSK